MKTMAVLVALICLASIFIYWGTHLAVAYAVAFAGWVPHCFSSRKVDHGQQA